MDKQNKVSGLKKAVLAISIVIVLNLFIGYGIVTFWDSPEYEDYCQKEVTGKTYDTKESCEQAGGQWQTSPEVRVPEGEIQGKAAYCQVDYTCSQEYQDARDLYNRNFFLIELGLGVVLVIVGLFAVKAQAVSLGLAFGGLLAIIVGTIRFWSGMQDYLRFVLLGLALVVLIWLGIKKVKD